MSVETSENKSFHLDNCTGLLGSEDIKVKACQSTPIVNVTFTIYILLKIHTIMQKKDGIEKISGIVSDI